MITVRFSEAGTASPRRDLTLSVSNLLHVTDGEAKGQGGELPSMYTCLSTLESVDRSYSEGTLHTWRDTWSISSQPGSFILFLESQCLIFIVVWYSYYLIFKLCQGSPPSCDFFSAETNQMIQAVRRTLDRRKEPMVIISSYCGFKISELSSLYFNQYIYWASESGDHHTVCGPATHVTEGQIFP